MGKPAREAGAIESYLRAGTRMTPDEPRAKLVRNEPGDLPADAPYLSSVRERHRRKAALWRVFEGADASAGD